MMEKLTEREREREWKRSEGYVVFVRVRLDGRGGVPKANSAVDKK